MKMNFDLINELEKDVYLVGSLVRSNQTCVSLRRAYVRTVFAGLEGVLFEFRRSIINSKEFETLFTMKEKGKLLEKKVEDGIITEFNHFLKLEDSIPFTVCCFAKAVGINDFEFPYNSDGWNMLKRSILLRHRITHPKSIDEFGVTVLELEELVGAKEWFKDSITKRLAE